MDWPGNEPGPQLKVAGDLIASAMAQAYRSSSSKPFSSMSVWTS